MEIPINVPVKCTDGHVGESMAIIYNPVSAAVTHLVVKAKGLHHEEYLVPLSVVVETSADQIKLGVSKDDFVKYPPFLRHTVDVVASAGDLAMQGENSYYWPYTQPDASYYKTHGSKVVHRDIEQIPHDELAVHKGAKVEATDGHLGTVDEFLINPENNHITHIVLHSGHMLSKKSSHNLDCGNRSCS